MGIEPGDLTKSLTVIQNEDVYAAAVEPYFAAVEVELRAVAYLESGRDDIDRATDG
jgi:hypothetical protein